MSTPQYREYILHYTAMKDFAAEMAYICDTQNITVILLYGEMGSGKTTFINLFVEQYNNNNFTASSPTYAYLNYYLLTENKQLLHIDLYRAHDVTNAMETFGIEEFLFYKKGIVAIEWPDKLNVIWEEKVLRLYFYYAEDLSKRKIIVKY